MLACPAFMSMLPLAVIIPWFSIIPAMSNSRVPSLASATPPSFVMLVALTWMLPWLAARRAEEARITSWRTLPSASRTT
ncbi:hypothetical protein D3C87_2079810 [compost metagenome]